MTQPILFVLFLGFFALCAPRALSQNFDLSWYTIDGGGGVCTGGGYELTATIGQPEAGVALSGGGFEVTGGFWSAGAPAGCRGDMNCDGRVGFDDINPFVAVLGGGACCDPTGYNCDVNGDGTVNFGDINPFVELLSAGGGPCR